MQGRYAKGLLLVIWEIVINTNAKVNLAIMYSLQGQFDLAKNVVDLRWLFLYIPLYVYSIWDGYRGTIDLNKLYLLADREDAPLTPFMIRTMDVNFLDKRNPWVATAWSAFMPGLGYLYIHKIILGIFFAMWTVVVIYFSHCLPAVYFTMIGHFSLAKHVLNMEWLMYIPSIYGFVMFDSYSSTVEYNKLFEKEQSKFLRDNYQDLEFEMPM